MYALMLSLLLAGSGTGSSHTPGRIRQPREIGPFSVSGGLLAGSTMTGWVAPSRGELTAIHWTESTAGSGTSMTYSVTVNGSPVCDVVVDCNSSGVVTAACADRFDEGDTLAVVVRVDNCLVGNPAGSLMLIVR